MKFACLVLVLLVSRVFSLTAAPIPVVLDTDIGDDIDDALALALALQSPELRILAVITVLQQGERRADLAWKILKDYDRTDIPIGIGAEQTLLGKESQEVVRQTSALGPGDVQPAERRQNGIRLLIDTIMKNPEKVTLLAYGPLTNVAIALRVEPRLREKLDRIVLMSGMFYKPRPEYNVYRDAEASAMVYASGIPITTVGLDVTLQCRLEGKDLDRLRASHLPSTQFLYKLIGIWQNGKPEQAPILHDPLAIAAVVRPDVVKLERGTVEVETRGTPGKTNGMTLFKADPKGTTEVAREVNPRAFIDLFLERVTAGPRAMAAAP